MEPLSSAFVRRVHWVFLQFLPLRLRDFRTFLVFLNSSQAKSFPVTCDLFDLREHADVWQCLLDDSVPTILWPQLSVSLYPGASWWHRNPAMMSWTAFASTNWAPLHVTRGWRASFFFPCDPHNHHDPITRRTSCPLCSVRVRPTLFLNSLMLCVILCGGVWPTSVLPLQRNQVQDLTPLTSDPLTGVVCD